MLSLHFCFQNLKIVFETSPVYVNERLTKCETDGFPWRCRVSAFGLGGTNCLVVLEEAPPRTKAVPEKQEPCVLLALSARSKEALKTLVEQYVGHLEELGPVHLSDLC